MTTLPPLVGTVLLTSWQLAPLVSAGLVLAALLYGWGAWRVRRDHPARPWPTRSALAFYAGLAVIGLATQSFVGVYDDVLFSVHMAQHLLLIMVAPVLLIWGRPVTLLLHASRNPLHTWAKRAVRSRAAGVLTAPMFALPAYTAVIVGTHLTGFMNTVLLHAWAHDLEHALYLVAGYLYFLPLVGREPIRWQLATPARAMVMLFGMPADTFTGLVLLMYTAEPFPAYAAAHRSWGPSLLTDLHNGGVIMWLGGDFLMAFLIIGMLAAWARTDRDRDQVGGFVQSARLAALADRTGDERIAALAARGTDRVSASEEDEMLAAYNRYLAGLHGGVPPGPPAR